MNTQAQAIDLIEQGDWHGAHELVQSGSDRLSCLIHAYLHREEGDQGNAAFWYSRAGEPFPHNTLAEELERLKSRLV